MRFLRSVVALTTLLFAAASIDAGRGLHDAGAPVESASGFDSTSTSDSEWRAAAQTSVAPTMASVWRTAAFHAGFIAESHDALPTATPARISLIRAETLRRSPPPPLTLPLRI